MKLILCQDAFNKHTNETINAEHIGRVEVPRLPSLIPIECFYSAPFYSVTATLDTCKEVDICYCRDECDAKRLYGELLHVLTTGPEDCIISPNRQSKLPDGIDGESIIYLDAEDTTAYPVDVSTPASDTDDSGKTDEEKEEERKTYTRILVYAMQHNKTADLIEMMKKEGVL